MSGSFFPTRDNELLAWAINYRDTIGMYGVTLGMTSDEIAEEISDCEALIDTIKNIHTIKAQLHAAKENRSSIITTRGGHLRAKISQHKTSMNFSTAIGEALKIVHRKTITDYSNYKANLRVDLFAGHIRIRFFKRGVDGINLYYRTKESDNWELVSRITISAFVHQLTFEVSHQAVHLEYRAYGVVKDREVGIASDIVEIIYGN